MSGQQSEKFQQQHSQRRQLVAKQKAVRLRVRKRVLKVKRLSQGQSAKCRGLCSAFSLTCAVSTPQQQRKRLCADSRKRRGYLTRRWRLGLCEEVSLRV